MISTWLVESYNEWDPLEEIIVGRIENGRVPPPGVDLHCIEYHELTKRSEIPSGPFDKKVVAETQEDLEMLCKELQDLGIVVQRPEVFSHEAETVTPLWRTTGLYNYCPRDIFLVVGRAIIETPVVLRSRQQETLSYKKLLTHYFQDGCRWISAPKPALEESLYDQKAPAGSRLLNQEPIFDAANVLRLGRDILFQISDSGNEMGFRWLSEVLSPEYQVHAIRNIYAHSHIDSTIVPLRPGLVLLNPERIEEDSVPEPFRLWDKIWCPEILDIGHTGYPISSKWIGMNLLMLKPSLAIVDQSQVHLIHELEKHQIDVLPLNLRHARTLGGGFHCVTLDIRRSGTLESYV